MPDLTHTLQGNDLGFLRMVAGTWGVELNAPDARVALPLLVKALLNRPLLQEVVEALPTPALEALRALIQNEGRIPWALFARRFGEVRVMGAGRRDRERPDLQPASPSEVLWYRALIGRTFLNASPEAQEFAYIPDDLLDLLPPLQNPAPPPPGRPASPGETLSTRLASSRILDHACTLLAALRLKISLDLLPTVSWGISIPALMGLLQSARLLADEGLPVPDATRAFLETGRGEALGILAASWMKSIEFNELRLLPGLRMEGDWTNQPLDSRQVLLTLLTQVPQGIWWSLNAFVQYVKERHPDFQRPAGDYDSWFILHEASGEYLRGFSTWDQVDGALVRFLISGPMHWVGIFDLAYNENGEPAAFRHSAWSDALWNGGVPIPVPEERDPLHIFSDGRLRLSTFTPRAVRYQVARFTAWEDEKPDGYQYRITPASLERASQQGLRPPQLITLLKKYASAPLPPSLLRALERWDKLGAQARSEKAVLLYLPSADVLPALRQSRAGRWLGKELAPGIVILYPAGQEAVRKALAELGYLMDCEE